MSATIEQRNQDATVYCGGLDEKVSEETLWELMLQAGPVVNVHMPKDKVTSQHQCYGFVEFRSEEDADYAMKIMNMVKLYGKPIRVNKSSQDKKNMEVGANLFIGNLDPEADEKLLYDTFSAFGGLTQTPKIMRDPETGNSKGFGFVSFDTFEAADLAIECMNNQYLCNRAVTVQYAYKKDSKERHGSQAERLLAQSNPNKLKPHTMFATGPEQFSAPPPAPMVGQAGGAPNGFAPPWACRHPPPPQALGQAPGGMGGAPPPPPPHMGGHPAGMPPPPPPSYAAWRYAPPAHDAPPPLMVAGVPPPPPTGCRLISRGHHAHPSRGGHLGRVVISKEGFLRPPPTLWVGGVRGECRGCHLVCLPPPPGGFGAPPPPPQGWGRAPPPPQGWGGGSPTPHAWSPPPPPSSSSVAS